MGSEGFVYAIRCTFTQRIKIGWTKHEGCQARVVACQTGSPTRLELVGSMPGTRADEVYIHQVLERYRLHGEWFKACDEVHDVAEVVAGGEPALSTGSQVWSRTGWWRGSKSRRSARAGKAIN